MSKVVPPLSDDDLFLVHLERPDDSDLLGAHSSRRKIACPPWNARSWPSLHARVSLLGHEAFTDVVIEASSTY
jgi:hypothetical protein